MTIYTYVTMLPGGSKLEVQSDGLEDISKAVEFVHGLMAPKPPAGPHLDVNGKPFDIESGLVYMAPVTIDRMVVGRHPVVVVPIEIESNLCTGEWKLTAGIVGRHDRYEIAGDDRYEISGEIGKPHPLIHKLTDCCRDIIT